MGRRGKNAILGGIIALLMVCGLGLPVMAEGTGIGLAPNIVQVDNALRGAAYDRSLIITNMGNTETDYSLTADGEAADWLSFYSNGGTIQQVTVPAQSTGVFEVKISVPEDAVNGSHKATLTVTSLPDASSAGQATVAVAAVSHLDIIVSGTQVIAGNVTGISLEDVETGYPLKIQVYMENTGNVEATPLITANITRNGIAVGSLTEDEAKVRAGTGEFITVEWDTTGNAAADYLAMVNVVLDGKTLATEELPFKILPLGTLTRSGELNRIVVNGAAIVNLVTKMTATFANTGQIDSWAEFAGEIYQGDQLVDTFSGEKLLIEKGTEANLVAYFKLAETGDYTIKGWVVYEGKKTETMEVSFEVIEPEPGNIAEVQPTVAPTQPAGEVIGNTGTPLYLYIIIALVGSTGIAGTYIFIWRRKQFVPVFVGSYNKVFKELAHNKLFKRFKFNVKKTKRTGKK